MLGKLSKKIGRYLLDSYKRSKQNSADNSLRHCLQAAHETIDRTKYCFLISNGSNGWGSARFVEPIVEDDFSAIWIGTNPNLRKIKEIQDNPKITLAFGNLQERANIVIYGEASLEDDIALRKRYWKGEWRLFFPSGPTGDDYVLIKIQPLKMEIMNFHRNVIREPFGLKPAVLEYREHAWNLETVSA
jgi:general stress protein 26